MDAFRSIYRLVPAGLRRPALRVVAARTLSRDLARRKAEEGPPIVAGLLGSASGLGQGCRNMVEALDRIGADYRCVDLCEWFAWHRALEPGRERLPAKGQGGSLLIHMNPPEFILALFFLRRFDLRNKRIVGYWAWELETIPETWGRSLSLVDEIWVPSTFVARALRRRTGIPVHVVPHPLPRMEHRPAVPQRAAFGIPEQATLFLTVFDARSSVARKNPGAAIRAFRAAFGDARDVLLMVKAGNLDAFPEEKRALVQEVRGAGNVRLLDRTLTDSEMAGLMQCADVIVSLHRSEGFGLVAAEGMALGKPVIATGWSGNMDFMTEQNSRPIGHRLVPLVDPQGIYRIPGAVWAEPDIGEAAEVLRALYRDPDERRRIGARARQDARDYFGLERFRRVLAERLGHPLGEGDAGMSHGSSGPCGSRY